MKNPLFLTSVLLLLLLISTPNIASAQFDDKSERLSLAQKISEQIDGKKIVIEYGAPEVKSRKIFGGLVPYGRLWRTGANEATTIELSEKLLIEGNELEKGKYALYTIPGEKEWTIILNSEFDQWGDFNYDEKKDVLRFKVNSEESEFTEIMKFEILKEGMIYLYWENIRVPIKISSIQQQ